MPPNYRELIYGRYASLPVAGRPVATQWIKEQNYFLRGWLPSSTSARCLDVGCGSGAFVELLIGQGFRNVSGCDISGEQVAVAQARGVPCVVGEALSALAGKEECYDLITAFDVVEHLSKAELLEFLERCYRALRVGGSLILKSPNASSPMGMSVRYGDFTHELGLTPNSLRHLLRLYGFNHISFREVGPVPHGVKSIVRKVGWAAIRTMLTALEYIETGGPGAEVKTRVMLCRAIRG